MDEPYYSCLSEVVCECSSPELSLPAALRYLQLPGVFSHISLVCEPFHSAGALPGQGPRLLGSLSPKSQAQCIGAH